MNISFISKKILIFCTSMLMCFTGSAEENFYIQARALQREGKFDEAIEAYKICLSQSFDADGLTNKELLVCTEALMQMMNTYQSKGEPESCVTALREVYNTSPVLQTKCLRDYYSILGYALSRTENIKEAEETMLKAFTMPLHQPTPERYFRDYAYAAAVFYSNPDYQKDVINWCQEALHQAQLCKNTSGKQWVMAMLGSLYKRSGDLDKSLDLFLQSKEEAELRNDELGVLNSLHMLTDIFLYWDIPEYADKYATEAVLAEKNMSTENPMVSAQTYIDKGRALHQLGEVDSIAFYTEAARKLCQSLPYNSGMVDVDLLHGIYMIEQGGDSVSAGIQELQEVARQGTPANRAKAYHQLAQTYLKQKKGNMAEVMLDSLCLLLQHNVSPAVVHLEYEPILDHYLREGNHGKVEHYLGLMFQEQQQFKEKRLNFNLVEGIVDFQTEKKEQELKISELRQANQRLRFLVFITISVITVFFVTSLLFYQKRQYLKLMKKSDEKIADLVHKLNETNVDKEMIAQEVREFLNDKDKRQKLETLTPLLLKQEGELKFRQCFELLYPLFLHRLREKVPSVSRREELLSMLIVLKQDNKKIADLMAIAPRSVLMLRHRFRQKIGMTTEYSLENFIEDTLGVNKIDDKE